MSQKGPPMRLPPSPAAAQAANPRRYETPGYALAMRVMQSDLYPTLDGRERAECDELIRIGQAPAATEVPIATLRFQRSTPGHENDMPEVVSCNWMPDGVYPVYLATPAATEAPSLHAEMLRLLDTAITHGHTVQWQQERRDLVARLKRS